MRIKVSIGKRKIKIEKLIAEAPLTSGACVIFVGIVRGEEKGKKVEKLEYTAYIEMAKKEMEKIGYEVGEKYGIDALYIHHRIGELKPRQHTLYILVFAPHRKEAFEACREILEMIKQRLPIWKKEFVNGCGRWK